MDADPGIETVMVEIESERYEVDVKIASDDAGETDDVSAEYDNCVAGKDISDLSGYGY